MNEQKAKPYLAEAKRRIKEAKGKQSYFLNLSDLHLQKIPDKVFEFKKLRILSLANNQLTRVPKEIGALKNLGSLTLENNQLMHWPKEIEVLKNLNELYLSDNQLTQVPKEIEVLKNLRILSLSNNQVTQLPKEIEALKNLRTLDLSHNLLTQVLKEIEALKNLRTLDLSYNQLTQVPKEIEVLKNLSELYLSDNQLTQLPKEIEALKNLQILILGNNQLTQVPKEIGILENLRILELDGNKNLASPPPSVVMEGIQAIRNYLKALDEKITVWTSKMVLVGEGGVGKTCLLDALEGKDFEKGKDTTHGIDIRKLSFPCPGKKDLCMDLNVWDFGGQDIYHATHQFYLTNHALFVLVWSARMGYEAGKIYKWLETIQALAPDSPILIVATHSKERGADLPKGDIENKYRGKVHFYEVDNENKQGIEELKEAITQFAVNLKYMGIERPKSWVDAAVAIKRMRRKHVPQNELFRIFKKNGVVKENHETLAVYLHELGDILYYPEEEELKDTVIIKPAWVSQHIARILDSDDVSKQAGFLPKALMQKLWHDLEPHLQDKFITLMEKFDLSYKTKSNVEISLIVEKLKYEEHSDYKKKWDNFEAAEREIAFKYELDTIPAGIPTWFIARTHRFSKYMHWRNGALLEDKEKKHLGLVMARPEDKEVWLKVKGIMPYYFFALLRDTLELTFNRFEGLKRVAKVPCPGHNGKPCNHFFELQDLEKKLKRKPPKFIIECPKAPEDADENVDIMQMLFGLSYAPENQFLVDQITKRVELKIDEQTKLLVNEMERKNEELIKFIQLEFIKSYKFQHEIMDQTCPNLFTLKPKDVNFFKKALDVDEFELQLYCQKPGHIHPVETGCYKVEIPKKWLLAIAPYYNKMLKILKWVLPVLQPAAGELLDEAVLKEMDSTITTFKFYANRFFGIEAKDVESFRETEILDEIHVASGSELRMIRQILGKKDTTQHWGGLERKVTPEGHILWLCPEHAKEYK